MELEQFKKLMKKELKINLHYNGLRKESLEKFYESKLNYIYNCNLIKKDISIEDIRKIASIFREGMLFYERVKKFEQFGELERDLFGNE